MEATRQQSILREWINQYKGLLFQVIRSYAFTESDRDDLYQFRYKTPFIFLLIFHYSALKSLPLALLEVHFLPSSIKNYLQNLIRFFIPKLVLFQEITIQVWKSIPNFKEKSAVSTWVYRVSLNTAMTWKRKEKKPSTGRQEIDQAQHLLQENEIKEDDRLVWLYEEIGKLNEIDRSVTLLLLDRYSYKDIPKMLGITESNVGVKINRIKKHLTTSLKKTRSIWSLRKYKIFGTNKRRKICIQLMNQCSSSLHPTNSSKAKKVSISKK